MKQRIQFAILVTLIVVLGILAWKIPSTTEQSKQAVDQLKTTEAASVKSTIAEIGKKAPDFKLETLTGEEVSLSDYRGKTVILNFWTTWCTYCKKEIPELINFHHLYEKENVVVLAVNLSSEEESLEQVALFSKEFEIPFQVPLDKEGMVAQNYQIIMIPTTYVIDPEGTVKNKILGPVKLDQLEKQLSLG